MPNHEIEPQFDRQSKILILGSFPSVKSRENKFYYGHPQNRFWKVLSNIYEDELPVSIEDKKNFLTRHHIALWDVIESCDIKGSSDASITNVIPVDIKRLLDNCKIQAIYCNGSTSKKLYDKYLYSITHIESIMLPSTSPANAMWTLDKLIEKWKDIRNVES